MELLEALEAMLAQNSCICHAAGMPAVGTCSPDRAVSNQAYQHKMSDQIHQRQEKNETF